MGSANSKSPTAVDLRAVLTDVLMPKPKAGATGVGGLPVVTLIDIVVRYVVLIPLTVSTLVRHEKYNGTALPPGVKPAVCTVANNYPYGCVLWRPPVSVNTPESTSGDGLILFTGSHCVRAFDLKRMRVETFAGQPEVAGGTDGIRLRSLFRFPSGIASSPADPSTVYVVESHAVRRISADGVVSTLAGSAAMETGFRDDFGTNARFHHPIGIAVSSSGEFLVVADESNARVRRIDTKTGEVTTLAGIQPHGFTAAQNYDVLSTLKYKDQLHTACFASLFCVEFDRRASDSQPRDSIVYAGSSNSLRRIDTRTGNVRTIVLPINYFWRALLFLPPHFLVLATLHAIYLVDLTLTTECIVRGTEVAGRVINGPPRQRGPFIRLSIERVNPPTAPTDASTGATATATATANATAATAAASTANVMRLIVGSGQPQETGEIDGDAGSEARVRAVTGLTFLSGSGSGEETDRLVFCDTSNHSVRVLSGSLIASLTP